MNLIVSITACVPLLVRPPSSSGMNKGVSQANSLISENLFLVTSVHELIAVLISIIFIMQVIDAEHFVMIVLVVNFAIV